VRRIKRLALASGLDLDPDTLRAAVDSHNPTTVPYRNALVGERIEQQRDSLGVEIGEKFAMGHQSHLCAEAPLDLRLLHRSSIRANDNEMGKLALILENGIGRERLDIGKARNLGNNRNCTDRDDDLARLDRQIANQQGSPRA
jgi:hypothetical protein